MHTDEMFSDPTSKDGKTAMFVLASEISEIGRIRFGCRDSMERDSWIQWLVRATRQNFEPTPTNPEARRRESAFYYN